jgi:radical SAM protein with 4Fe4S-binding SPASM domain
LSRRGADGTIADIRTPYFEYFFAEGLINTMLYRQKSDAFIRIFDNGCDSVLGYITSKDDLSDRVVDASGAMFLMALSRKPKTLDTLCQEIAKNFADITPEDIRQDAVDFFTVLEDDGFIVRGETDAELDRKDTHFSYSALKPKNKTDFSLGIQRVNKSTQEYLDERFKGNPRLMSLQIEITSKCNERCVHCYIPHKNRITDIDPALFYNVLDQCGEIGLLDIALSGGEPLLHKNFCDFLYRANDHDLSIEVFSNLTLLTDEIIKTMKAVRVRDVQTSLYSIEPAIHDAITLLPGSCEKTKKGLIRLIDAGVPVSIVCPVMKQNKDTYSDVLRWAQSFGVHSGSDTHILARSDRSTDNLKNCISIDEDIGVISGILENDPDAYNHERFSPDYHNPDKAFPYIQGLCKRSLCVNSAGEVLPNPAWYNVLGNLHTQTLRDIWENSAKIKRLRNIGIRDFPKCRTCPDIQFCGMSLVANANENPDGDIFTIPEHICEHARLERKLVWTWWKGRKDQQGKTNALSSEI